MPDTDTIPATDFDSALKRLEEMGNQAVRDRMAFNEWFIAQPGRESQCQKHGNPVKADMDASYRWKLQHGEHRVTFAACPDCQLERTNERQSEWLLRAGVPPLYRLESFETFKVETDSERANLAACRAFGASPRGFLLMHGNTGAGKTHLCVSVLRYVQTGRYRTHAGLLAALRDGYGNRFAQEAFAKVRGSALLILDEFGVSVGGADDPMMIHDLLNHRFENKLPTVIATNLPVPEFKTVIGERIESRMRQALAHKLNFDGRDRRSDMKARYLAG